MTKVLFILGTLALGTAVLIYPIAGIISGGAVEAYIIAAKDPTLTKTEKELFKMDPPKEKKDSKAYRDAVMSIYGSPTDEPTKVVFVSAERFVHPEELPTLALLPVDKQKGENPLQVKTVQFFALRTCIGAASVGFVLTVAGIVLFFIKKALAPPPAA
jgi:hypothetical protein